MIDPNKEYYDVQEIIDNECLYEPIKCRFCDSLEVDFIQYMRDAYCNMCGEWQRDAIKLIGQDGLPYYIPHTERRY